jgi:hypothetical protein
MGQAHRRAIHALAVENGQAEFVSPDFECFLRVRHGYSEMVNSFAARNSAYLGLAMFFHMALKSAMSNQQSTIAI